MKTETHPLPQITSNLKQKLQLSASGCILIAASILAGSISAGQCQAQTLAAAKPAMPAALAFDTVLIRPTDTGAAAAPASSNIPIGADDAFRDTEGLFAANNMPLVTLIQFAYRTGTGQRESLRAQLPDWALTQGFTIQAVSSNHAVTKDQMRLMVRTMLADRFHLVVHNETRQTQVLEVVLDKPGVLGAQLRRHLSNAPCTTTAQSQDHPDPKASPAQTTLPDGFPSLCGSFVKMQPGTPGLRREGARDMQMGTAVTSFSSLGNLGVPAVDQTGLTGTFDWILEFKPDPQPGQKPLPEAIGPSFQQALKDELGLSLKPQKAPFQFLIIDHLERASN